MQQTNETDWEFLWRLAARIDFEVLVVGDQLHFRRAGGPAGSAPIPLRWGEQLVSFRPRVTGVQQVKDVVVRGWEPAQQGNHRGNCPAGAARIVDRDRPRASYLRPRGRHRDDRRPAGDQPAGGDRAGAEHRGPSGQRVRRSRGDKPRRPAAASGDEDPRRGHRRQVHRHILAVLDHTHRPRRPRLRNSLRRVRQGATRARQPCHPGGAAILGATASWSVWSPRMRTRTASDGCV